MFLLWFIVCWCFFLFDFRNVLNVGTRHAVSVSSTQKNPSFLVFAQAKYFKITYIKKIFLKTLLNPKNNLYLCAWYTIHLSGSFLVYQFIAFLFISSNVKVWRLKWDEGISWKMLTYRSVSLTYSYLKVTPNT